MFKLIPGNHSLKINLNSEVVSSNPNEYFVIENKLINIKMFGKERWVGLDWLSHIAHFEVDLPEDVLFSIIFQDIYNKSLDLNCNKIMILRKRMVIDNKYRVIPNFTKYAVSQDGEIIELNKRLINGSYEYYKERAIDDFNYRDGYKKVKIYDPDKSRERYVPEHRLIALAWIPNYDFLSRSIINHINGIKTDNRIMNLEWCTYTENNTHAHRTGLRQDSIKCKIRSIKTGEIRNFDNLTEASKFIKLGDNYYLRKENMCYPPTLIRKEWEIKFLDDNSPWFFEATNGKKGRYIIRVKQPGAEEEVYADIKDFRKAYTLWNIFPSHIHNLVEVFRTRYPQLEITVEDTFENTDYQALNVKSGKVHTSKYLNVLSRITKVTRGNITRLIRNKSNQLINGYLFRYASDKPWDMDYTEYFGDKPWLVVYNATEKHIFGSLREAGEFLGKDRSVVKRCLEQKTSMDGWNFQDLRIKNT